MPDWNSQLRKFQNYILYIYKKLTFIAIKTKFFFGSHLGCHIVLRLSYKLFKNTKVIF